MGFQDYEYTRVNIEKIKEEINSLLNKVKNSAELNEFLENVEKINKIRRNIKTMTTLCEIRHTINTEDEFYKKEKEFVDEISPKIDEIDNEFFKTIINSKFREELNKTIGKTPLKKVETYINTFNPEVLTELEEENKLISEYGKIVASAKIDFEGETLNLSGVMKFAESEDRTIRKKAMSAYFGFFEEKEKEIDEIYDKLIKVRTKIAKKLGYDNFIPLAYNRLMRVDYNSSKVKVFRDSIAEFVVPVVSKFKEQQAKRLGIDKLHYYDEPLLFPDGNAKLKEGISVAQEAKKMFSSMSPLTKEFFLYMTEEQLMDLETKKGKRMGAYCEFLRKYKSPFVFCNFNGTSNDVNELTHESGHAFDCYLNRNDFTKDYSYCGYETAEIHSMSMEFLSQRWMDLFLDNPEKYNYINISSSLFFLPYGCIIDEFQHWVYEDYNASPEERKKKWKELEKKYLPHKSYDDNEFLNRGVLFTRQLHLFEWPFYYIDYVLAQICAFQIWAVSKDNFEEGFEKYLKVVKDSDKRSFTETLEHGELENPFKKETIQKIIKKIEDYLNDINTDKFMN